jgi:molecular chaperone DnaK (HSP70)
MTIVVGIDLGTSNTSICYFKNGKLEIIKDGNYHNISSVIAFTKYGCVFGNKVKMMTDNNLFVSNIKRLIGYEYNDLLLNYYDQFSFKIINYNGKIGIKNENSIYTPNELMSYFLNYLKKLIEYEILCDYKVIVTVPAYFNIQQKEAISDCIKSVGFNLIKLLSEPTSASVAYGNFINYKNEDNILIFDLGGGTLDLSIINISANEDDIEKTYDVLATYGNNKFGGSDLTFELIEYIKKKYSDYYFQNNNLFEYIDKLKIKLNNGMEQETIIIDKQQITITCNEFNFIVDNWIQNIDKDVNKVLEIADLNKSEISHVLLVGGTSKIKQVKNNLEKYFNKKINSYFIDKTNISLEDLAVSYGSAYHGNILYSTKNILLLDVCPFNIGVESADGTMVPIINSNSKIPIKRTKQFTTDEDNMTKVKIKIYQGDSKFVKNNIYLGEFILDGIPKAQKGVPVIHISIEINNNGLLRVSARDRKNNTNNEISISAKDYKLNDKDIEKVKQKMNLNKESENILFELLEKYNTFLLNFDRFIYGFMISPVVDVHDDYRKSIISDISLKVLEIYFTIKLEAFDNFVSFNKFIKLVNILFSDVIPNDYKIKDFIDNHEKLLIHLKNLFDKFNKYLLEKYSNFLVILDNTTLENQTYDKEDKDCDISDQGFSKTDDIMDFNKKLLNNILGSELGNLDSTDLDLADYNIKLYEYSELVNGLLNSLDVLPITIVGKNLLINFIGDDQEELQKNMINNDHILNTKLLIESINKINDYCKELAQNYHHDYTNTINDLHLTAEQRLNLNLYNDNNKYNCNKIIEVNTFINENN